MSLSPQKLSVLYRQLSQQLAAGLTFAEALRSPAPAPADDLHRLADLAESGRSVSEVVASAGPWLPAEDRPFLIAAARAGRLPAILAHLSVRCAQIHSTRIRLTLACAYPLVVFHLGALIFPALRLIDFSKGFQWSISAYLGGLLALLLPVWGGAVLLWFLVRHRNRFALSFLDRLPAIGGYRKHQALADLSFALGHLLGAGLPIADAWTEAGNISRSPRLLAASRQLHDAILNRQAPGPLLTSTGAFPPEFVSRYRSGETSGTLDSALLALAADHQAQAHTRLTVASMLYPALLFGAVALMVAYFVVRFYAGYFDSLNHLMDNT